MKKHALQIRRIQIREAPGIGSGLEPLEDLSPGINVIYGPNGSGKSTTLRLMQASLSPNALTLRCRGDRVETEIGLDEMIFTVTLRDLEFTPADGIKQQLGPELIRDCRFSLRELLDASSGGEYGPLFQEAAAGGLDLLHVARSLGLANGNTLRPIDRKNLAELKANLVAKENEVGKLDATVRDLARLEEEQCHLQSAADRLHLLRDGIRHWEKLRNLDLARTRLNEFPPCMKNLAGDELQKLQHAEKEILSAIEKLHQLRADWRLKIRAKKESDLRMPVPQGLLKTLDEKQNHLENLERDLQQSELKLSEASAEMQAAQEPIGEEVPENVLKAANSALLDSLEHWCDRVEAYQGKVAALAELEQDLGDMDAPPASGAAKDIQLLRDWLAADRSREKTQKLGKRLIWAAIFVFVVSLVVGFVLHYAGFSGVLGALFLGLAALEMAKGREDECRREAEEKCQQKPEAWTRPAVHLLIEQREQKYAEELERQQRVTRWKTELKNRKAALDREMQQLTQDERELFQTLGFTPRLGPKSFGIVARALIDWQVAYRKSAGAAGALAQSQKAISALCDAIKIQFPNFARYGLPTEFHSAELAGLIAELRQRDQQFQSACSEMKNIRSNVSSCLGTIRAARAQITELFDKIAPHPPEETQLRALLERLAEFQLAREEVAAFGHSETEARKFFQENPDLAAIPLEDMQKEAAEIGSPEARLQEVNQKIGAINERLRAAQNATDVERLRVAFDNAQAALQTERQKMLARLAVMKLAEQIQHKVASETVPRVLRRAGELLRRFTHGTCELHVTPDGIKAIQPAQGKRTFELEELSDGTRAQMFIAIRLAFVEEGETHLRVPLFFDEAFANTDSERAGKIMETLLEISRQGRQIFCFTSQVDEFSRWQETLTGQQQNEVRFLTIRKGFPQPIIRAGLRPPPRYPKPEENELYREYAERIGCWQKLDPWVASLDEMPIVPLLEHPRDLHALLESGIQSWGPIARLGAEAGIFEGGEIAFQNARCRAEFLYGVCTEWQRGRGLPITREHLQEAGVTNIPTSARLDQVWEHAERVGRDAELLCQALENREVCIPQLGTSRIANLREYCEEKGLIVSGKPFEEGELRLRASNLGRKLGLSAEEVDHLLEFFVI